MEKKKSILYIVRYPAYEEFNLKGKFDGQLDAFRKLNMSVFYLTFDQKFFYLVHNDKEKTVGRTTFSFPMYFHTKVYYDMYKTILKVLDEFHFDYVYWRDAPIWYSSYKLGKKLHNSGTKIIYEIPTYCKGGENALSFSRKIFSIYSNLWKDRLMQYPNLFIFTGDADFDKYYGKPAVNIDNGVDVDMIPLRQPANDKNGIHILALASMSYWHGYDRLIKSLSQYSGDHQVIIHMVGGNDGGMLPEWRKLTSDLRLEDKIIFHGKLYGDDLTKIFDLCDVGINSLGLYRKNMDATSELKIREYAARGLPFVCSVEDPAFKYAKEEMWIMVANDESIPDMKEIVDFALKMRENPEHPAKLRQYAKDYMSWEGQYSSVFKMV